MKFHMQLLQVKASQVAQLDLFQVLPQPFHRVEVRRVRRQRLQVDSPAGLVRQECLDLGPPVDRRPVPDHQDAARNLANQVCEERDAMQPVEGMWPHQRVHLSFGRHASHNRQMVARLPLVHDWRLAPRAVGPDHPRQEVEARFVHENEGPVFAAGLLLQNWPRFDPPPLDGFFVPLDRPGDRDLRSPSQVLEQARYLALAVRDAELLVNGPGDTLTGPDVSPKAVGLRSVPEEVGDQPELFGCELGDRARGGMGAESFWPTPSCSGGPTTNRGLGGIEGGCDVALLPALSLEPVPSFAATPSSHEVANQRNSYPIIGSENFTSLCNAQ